MNMESIYLYPFPEYADKTTFKIVDACRTRRTTQAVCFRKGSEPTGTCKNTELDRAQVLVTKKKRPS